ncbi:MAG TPA: alginate lyase family protein, partial [Tepidisphaeraceae bacterium]
MNAALPVVVLLLVTTLRVAAGPVSLTEPQREKLAKLVAADPEAGKRFAEIRRTADASLTAEPNPIHFIRSEGKLKGDPEKIATGRSMADMNKLQALGFAYAVTRDARYADAARRFLVAWAGVNVSRGDPIDDTGLEPLIVCYDLVRATCTGSERNRIDGYLRQVADAEIMNFHPNWGTAKNNWNSHRIKIIGMVGFAIDDRRLIDHTVAAFKAQIDQNLEPDGSSLDFHERDALHYHCYDLEPLLTLAIVTKQAGVDLYSHHSPRGASLAKSVQFLVPYCDGSRTHAEFVHSKVAFDRKRAESGDARYKAGTPFDPKAGRGTLELAAYFDPSLNPLVIQLSGGG